MSGGLHLGIWHTGVWLLLLPHSRPSSILLVTCKMTITVYVWDAGMDEGSHTFNATLGLGHLFREEPPRLLAARNYILLTHQPLPFFQVTESQNLTGPLLSGSSKKCSLKLLWSLIICAFKDVNSVWEKISLPNKLPVCRSILLGGCI